MEAKWNDRFFKVYAAKEICLSSFVAVVRHLIFIHVVRCRAERTGFGFVPVLESLGSNDRYRKWPLVTKELS